MSSLSDFVARHDRLICIDSDGCAFDTMGIKHKECFCPAYIEYFALQPVAEYARQAWEFVNLYSQTRGINRFLALLRSLDLLAARLAAAGETFAPPQLPAVRAWAESTGQLANDSLAAALRENPQADLRQTLAWSEAVNRHIERLVHGVPPFPQVRESLAALAAHADVVIVSATPAEALRREWQENDLMRYVAMVCGQDVGGKREIIAALSPQYAPGRVLMIGDAPGDLAAAQANKAAFYPICPGQERASWRDFMPYAEQFFAGRYEQQPLVQQFAAVLPETPPWETR